MPTRPLSALLMLLLATGLSAQSGIQNKGSDTLVNVAQSWAAAYSALHPELAIAVNGGGSGNGIAAMLNGDVDIANASRGMKPGELALARERGLNPMGHLVGYDAVAVYLHPNNPNRRLGLDQLREIYQRGGSLERWSQVGEPVPGCASDEIVVVSRQNNSGTYAYFRQRVLGRSKYRQGTLDLHGSKNLVDLIASTPCAIGYSGLAYAKPGVQIACIVTPEGGCIRPNVSNASGMALTPNPLPQGEGLLGGPAVREEGLRNDDYPLSRPLLMYTNGEPKGDVRDYIRWIGSDAGQCILIEKGYAPVRDVECSEGARSHG